MQIQRQQYTEAGAILSYPAFLADAPTDAPTEAAAQAAARKQDRKQNQKQKQKQATVAAENARRMTAFYEYMKDCVLEYCRSEAFPAGARYFVDYRVTEAPAGYDIEILLRLRIRGRSVGSACLSHRWRDGVLDLQKPERVCRKATIFAKRRSEI